MEETRFDDFSRAFAGGTSRRRFLRRLAAGTAGGALVWLGERETLAKPRKKDKKPKPGHGQRDCCPHETPRLCPGVGCVDFFTDPYHCGGCGIVCGPGQTCEDGICTDAGESGCTSDADCDDGNACNGLETCDNGTCLPGVPPDCDDGLPCTEDVCDPFSGGCVSMAVPGLPCTTPEGVAGTCDNVGMCRPPAECPPGAVEECADFPRMGACAPGMRTCQDDGTWGACEGGVGPQPETCNGLDDDCDGLTDNNAPCDRHDEVCIDARCCVPSGESVEFGDCDRCCRGDCRTFTSICE